MDPVTLFLAAGFVGGVGTALVLVWLKPRPTPRSVPDAFASEPISTDVINMARIRVAGIGGLGLVATAIAVGLYVPEIRRSLLVGCGLGAVFASILILRRYLSGPMPSSGRRPGANTTLSIDEPFGPNRDEEKRPPGLDRATIGAEKPVVLIR